MTDASKLQYYTGYNTYKNLGVRSASVTVSGSTAPSAISDWQTTVTFDEDYKYSTAKVRTNDVLGGSVRWQGFPAARFYRVPVTGHPSVTEFAVTLLIEVNGNQVTFKATVFNGTPDPLNWTTTTIDFEYAVHTTVF